MSRSSARLTRRGLLAGGLIGGAAAIAASRVGLIPHATAREDLHLTRAVEPITVEARPIDAFKPGEPERRRFGALVYRGGMALTSPSPVFGGISAMRIAPDGENFIAVSDNSAWFTGRIVYSGMRPVGLAGVKTGPMLAEDGQPLADRGWYDAEALALNGHEAYVAFERVRGIARFDISQGVFAARGRPIAVPTGFRDLPVNKEIEGLVYVPPDLPLAGTLIAFSERGLDAVGNLLAFLIGGPTPGRFAITRTDKYDLSDAALLPNGEVLLLERKFSLLSGPAIRLRTLPLVALRPGAVVDAGVLMEADMGHEIDNLEAVDVHRAADGTLVITMMSDDNFSPIQRTLLLQFALER